MPPLPPSLPLPTIPSCSACAPSFTYTCTHKLSIHTARHEQPPYDASTMRSSYHVRSCDVFRMKQVCECPMDTVTKFCVLCVNEVDHSSQVMWISCCHMTGLKGSITMATRSSYFVLSLILDMTYVQPIYIPLLSL